MLKKLKIMQGVFAPYIICQAFTLLALFLLSSVIYAQTTIKTEIRLLPEGMLKEISEIETPPARLPFEPEMVRIPRGSFTMGEDNNDGIADPEEPAHEVMIDYNFEVSQYEITRGEFRHFVNDPDAILPNFDDVSDGRICQGASLGNRAIQIRRWDNLGFEQEDDHPVVCVSWDDAHAYINWLNSTTGKVYRLLSESEWEYVARAGVTNKKYSIGEEGSDDITHTNARYGQSDGTVAVGRYAPNNFGLYDVHGNVNEIIQDCWHFAYALIEHAEFTGLFRPTTNTSVKGVVTAPSDGSAWAEDCQPSVFLRRIPDTDFTFYRGGSWNSALADHLEVTYRGNAVNDLDDLSGTSAATYTRSDQTGFRLARTIPELGITAPPTGTPINIQSATMEVTVGIEGERESAATISLALADGGELVVNPPSSPIRIAANMKEASFTLTAVGGGSTTLTITVRDSSGKTDTRDIQVNGPSIYPEMVKIPSIPEGSFFSMGAPRSEGGSGNERPVHDVNIGYSFAAGKFELTQAQYGAFAVATSHANNNWNTGNNNHPAANINVSDVEAYIDWLNMMTGQKYRLLSESEWEYAARAGTTTRYSNGSDSITTQTANYNNSSGGAVEVGSYAPNNFGLYNIHGNVSEWVADCWHNNYKDKNKLLTNGVVWDRDCSNANIVYRGGSFENQAAGFIRSAKRFSLNRRNRVNFLGVRIARTLEASDPNSPP